MAVASVANCYLPFFVDLSLWPESNWSMRLEPIWVPNWFEIDFAMTMMAICLAFLTHVLLFVDVEFFAMEKSSWAMEANSCSI